MANAKQVKESLLKQLEIKGAKVDIYLSLIDDFMWFWQQERKMQKDVKDKGRTYTAVSASGKDYEKSNPSVKDALLYSKQMMAIIDALGLNTKTVTDGAGDGANGDLG